MIRIKTNEVYTAERVRSGTGANGAWELLVVKDGKDELTLWASNPGSGVTEGGQFRIKSIDNFAKKKVPYKDGRICRDRSERNVEWRTEVDANITVEAVGFSEAPFDFGSDMPFDFGGSNPFDDDELPL